MLNRILVLMKKEFIQVIRDRRTLYIAFIMPVVLLIIFGYAISFDVKEIRLGIYDEDKSSLSRQLLDRFIQSSYFKPVAYLRDGTQIEKLLDSGEANVVLIIPPSFSKGMSIQTIIDGSDPAVAGIVSNYVNEITENLPTSQTCRTCPIDARVRIFYNQELKSINFIIPGIITIVTILLCVVLTSTAVVRERERGTIERLMTTPIKPYELMLGKILPYGFIALVDILLVLLVGIYWFGVVPKGSLLLLLATTLIFALTGLGIGLLISSVTKTQQVAMLLAFLTTLLPSILLSGFIFPIESMPDLLQYITYIIPARYFLIIERGIFLKGIGVTYLWSEILVLSLMGVTTFGLSSILFKKRLG